MNKKQQRSFEEVDKEFTQVRTELRDKINEGNYEEAEQLSRDKIPALHVEWLEALKDFFKKLHSQ